MRSPPSPASRLQTVRKENLPNIFGVVRDEAGSPLHGALVRALHIASDIYQFVAGAETLEDGAYSLDGFLLDKRYMLVASAPGFASSASDVFQPEGEQAEIDFVLARIEVDAEVEAIISGAKAHAQKFRSGRFRYTAVSATGPIHYTDEQIERQIEKQERIFRSDPLITMSEEQIQSLLARERKQMVDQQQSNETSKGSYSGEYIFEGNNLHHIVLLYRGLILEKYVYENEETVFSNEGDRSSATIGGHSSQSELYSPLNHFLRLLSSLSAWEWRILDRQQAGGGMTYTLQRTIYETETEIEVVIFPEKGYYINEYKTRHKSGVTRRYSFADMKWNADLGGYYPSEIREESHSAIVDRTLTLSLDEVEFNKDYDDNIFKPVFEEGMRITDRRFDPPKRFIYRHPENESG